MPWDLIKGLDPTVETAQQLVETAPPELLAFLASFVLAALFLVLALVNLPSRLLALLAGGTASGLVGLCLLAGAAGRTGPRPAPCPAVPTCRQWQKRPQTSWASRLGLGRRRARAAPLRADRLRLPPLRPPSRTANPSAAFTPRPQHATPRRGKHRLKTTRAHTPAPAKAHPPHSTQASRAATPWPERARPRRGEAQTQTSAPTPSPPAKSHPPRTTTSRTARHTPASARKPRKGSTASNHPHPHPLPPPNPPAPNRYKPHRPPHPASAHKHLSAAPDPAPAPNTHPYPPQSPNASLTPTSTH